MGSDHRPLLMEISNNQTNPSKYFKFLNYWTNQRSLLDTLRNYWKGPIESNLIWIFDWKNKRLATTLSKLSKAEFRDIYAKVKEFEEMTRLAKEKSINSNLEENKTNLHAFNVEYIRYLKLEDFVVS